jgi:hypothetical protein
MRRRGTAEIVSSPSKRPARFRMVMPWPHFMCLLIAEQTRSPGSREDSPGFRINSRGMLPRGRSEEATPSSRLYLR